MFRFFRPMAFVVLTLCGITSWGRTLIVTDIDDTLKIAHVRDSVDKVIYGARTDRAFVGMAELLSEAAKRPDVEVIYLSNAPEWLMGNSHRTFLNRHGFPRGRIYLRGFGTSSESHKPEVLQKIVETEDFSELILLGDNGERDPLYFEELQKAYPDRSIFAYVHAIYRDNLHNVQYQPRLIPFVSAYDLAVNMGLHQEASLIESPVHQALLRDLRDEPQASQVTPEWTHCHPDAESTWSALTEEWRLLLGAGCDRGVKADG